MGSEAIRIQCEGSGCPPATRTGGLGDEGMCSMCGRWYPLVNARPVLSDHDLDEILAMIARGDFDQ